MQKVSSDLQPAAAVEDDLATRRAVSRLPVRLPGLDVVRALAAVFVLIDHTIAGVLWLPAVAAVAVEGGLLNRAAWHAAKSFGLWGVGMFFVLSGVCIHLPNARKHAEAGWTLRIGPYLRRRFMRIYPPHLFALLLGIAVVAVAPSIAARADQSLIKPPTLRFFVLHLLMVHSFFADAFASINVVLWTIAIEWHFYLAYPLILWARRRVSMRTICLALLALSLGVRFGSSHFISSVEVRGTLANSIVCRWWEWALGCYVAELLLLKADGRVISRATAGLALAGSLAVAVGLTDLGRANLLFTYLGPPVFAFALFFGARVSTQADGAVDRILVGLGRESYSLYLTHPISLALATAATVALGLPWYVAAALMVTMAVTLSHAFFSMIEHPFMSQASAMKALEAAPAPERSVGLAG